MTKRGASSATWIGLGAPVLIAFVFAIAFADLGCCAHASPARLTTTPTPPGAEPTTEEGCRSCGGEWAAHGVTGAVSCLCPTPDADKRCRDGGECQGQCLGDGGEREVTAAGPPARGYFVGRCSRFRTNFGCHRVIARGALQAGPVALDEPPTEMCAD